MWIKFCKSTISNVQVNFSKVFKTFINVPSDFSLLLVVFGFWCHELPSFKKEIGI